MTHPHLGFACTKGICLCRGLQAQVSETQVQACSAVLVHPRKHSSCMLQTVYAHVFLGSLPMMNEVLMNVMEQPVPQNSCCTAACLSCTATCCTVQVAETIHSCNGCNCMANLCIWFLAPHCHWYHASFRTTIGTCISNVIMHALLFHMHHAPHYRRSCALKLEVQQEAANIHYEDQDTPCTGQ